MARKVSVRQILERLPDQDRLDFIKELSDAIEKAEQQRCHDPIRLCLDEWEATAELNMVPGLNQAVWKNYCRVRKRMGYAEE